MVGNILEEKLNVLFTKLYKSKTIRPLYKKTHIIYALLLIGENQSKERGIGRYRIMEDMNLGEGSTKTLINRLKEVGLVQVFKTHQKGHFLTDNGREIYKLLIEKIGFPKAINNPENPDKKLVIGKFAHYIRLQEKIKNQDLGIKQRDAAIMIGGSGATCLRYNGKTFVFPDSTGSQNTTKVEYKLELNDIKKDDFQPNDILIIGGSNDEKSSILATLAATLTLFNIYE